MADESLSSFTLHMVHNPAQVGCYGELMLLGSAVAALTCHCCTRGCGCPT